MDGLASKPLWQEELKIAIGAATDAGNLIRSGFSVRSKDVEDKKNTSDLVTETDVKSEELVFSRIRTAFPSHVLIGEESSVSSGPDALTDEPTWMCDPLDGTTNFVHSYPNVCVSIALVVKKQVVVGVVYNPITEELFTATKGSGAFLNGRPIRCSGAQDMKRALLATEIGVTRDETTFHAVFLRISKLVQAMQSVRCTGSCALNLCSVASGRIDAFYEIGFGGCWDVAAGALIVSEAGGALIDPAGGPFGLMSRRVLAGTPAIVPQVSAILAACPTSEHEPPAPASS
ncbi:L-galactose-1-phosphate phosphatase [Dunaliella salina]|uniref:Inositol-1-monophosphatase n=1 Tax=Dunaliella salina TaxID=3046 RepID=A0ABQ7H0A8_DUNSA|nr:L-galactose-1-phosphate phosphatase [Dunaliella salina]|eukprot:KAF5840285.1 L-galactose-1-phosphate phosphatase [Dunaliella salina]